MNARPQLGVKRRCLTCSTAFYDLNRDPIACPKCQAAFQVVEIAHSRPTRAPIRYGKPLIQAEPAEVEATSTDSDDEEAGEESTIPPREDEDEVENVGELIEIEGDEKTAGQ